MMAADLVYATAACATQGVAARHGQFSGCRTIRSDGIPRGCSRHLRSSTLRSSSCDRVSTSGRSCRPHHPYGRREYRCQDQPKNASAHKPILASRLRRRTGAIRVIHLTLQRVKLLAQLGGAEDVWAPEAVNRSPVDHRPDLLWLAAITVPHQPKGDSPLIGRLCQPNVRSVSKDSCVKILGKEPTSVVWALTVAISW